ncbi:hypothetical protein EBS02_02875 [bacterium]|nr:hypothetical protein [bacterium]
MNALDQAKNPDLLSKIAAVGNAAIGVFPRAELLLCPFTKNNMGDNWEDYLEKSKNSIDFAIKTKSAMLSVFIVTDESNMLKCDLVVVDFVSDNLHYVWESEFDLLKKKKKEIILSAVEHGNAPSYIKNKCHQLCGSIFSVFDS